MDESSNTPSESDFQDVFAAEMGVESEKPANPPAPAPAADDKNVPEAAPAEVPPAEGDKPVEGEPAKPEAGTEKTDEEKAADAEAEKVKGETPEETTARHAKEAADKAAADAPKPLTKEDLIATLAEREEQSTTRINNVAAAQNEIIKQLHPNGIDQKIYDTNGNVIKTAQDIVDRGLVNERTNEPYTYEEAASFMLQAAQQMAKNVEELNDWAEKVAEQNINLQESNQRVMAKYGDVLKTLPKETVQLLADTYINKQLKFDPTNSYITEMNMSPEEYYDTVMAPYSNLRTSIQAEKTQEQKDAEAKAASEQAERNGGIPPQRGTSTVKANTGNEFTDALMDELAKG